MEHYPAYLCENGHIIETSLPVCNDKYCARCGARVISQCPNCHATIQGHEHGVSGYYSIPSYCTGCGKPYPWLSASIEATTHMIEESELEYADQKRIIDILPDVITETPKTQLAAFRIQKAISSGSKFLAEGLRQFVIEFGCEVLKQKLGF